MQELHASVDEIGRIRKAVADFFSSPVHDGTSFSTDLNIPGTETSFAEWDMALGYVLDSITSWRDNNRLFLLPHEKITTLRASLDAIAEQLNGILSYKDEPKIIKKVIDKAQYTFVLMDDSPFNFQGELQSAVTQFDSVLSSWALLRTILDSPRYSDLSETLAILSTQRAVLDDRKNETKVSQRILTNARLKYQKATKEVDASKEEIDAIKQQIDHKKTEAENLSVEVKTNYASATETIKLISALESQVKAYEKQFQDFEASLNSRNEDFEEGSARKNTLLDEIGTLKNEVDRLTTQANGMLMGATNAGLAGTFSKREIQMGTEVDNARKAFYWSIGFLVISALPILIYVFPFLHNWLGGAPIAVSDPIGVISQITGRALLLVPGFFLMRFAAVRHERLFRLREHYQYKYSIAVSVEGFKRQAPGWEEQIAAATFFELTTNPANDMEAKASDVEHPIKNLEKLMKWAEGKEGVRIIKLLTAAKDNLGK